MSELPVEKFFGWLLLLGVVIALAFYVLAWLTQMVKTAWLWVDDREPEGPYPMTHWVARLLGYRHDGGPSSLTFINKTGMEKQSSDLLFAVAIGCIFIPLLSYLLFRFYPIAIGLALLYAIAHTARFARRHKKLFDKHVKDPEAHK